MDTIKARLHSFLRASEKYTKTDMIYLAKSSFWVYGGQVATGLVGLFLTVIFANFVPKENYGTYKYILSLYGIFATISLSGLGPAISRAVAKGYEGEFMRSIKINLRWNLVIFATALIGSIYYFFHANSTLGYGLLIIGIFFPILDTAELYNAFLSGKKDFRKVSLYSILRITLAASWMGLTIIFTKNPILLILSYFFIHTAIVSFIMLRVIKTRKPNHETHEETFKLAKHVSFISSFSGFIDQMDNVLVFHFLGPIALAVYNFAQVIPENLGGFIKSIGGMAFPKFAQRDGAEVVKTLRHKSFQVFLFGLAMAVVYILVAPLVFSTFFPQYAEAVRYSQVYALMLLFLSSIIPLAYIDSRMAIKEKYIMAISSSILKIVLMLFGIIYFGLWGLIAARIGTKLFGILLADYYAQKV